MSCHFPTVLPRLSCDLPRSRTIRNRFCAAEQREVPFTEQRLCCAERATLFILRIDPGHFLALFHIANTAMCNDIVLRVLLVRPTGRNEAKL